MKPTFPQTNAPHGHSLGAGLGAAGGGAAGAAIGSAAGPLGTLVGGVVGAVAGGLAGEGLAEAVNPSEEEEHWRGAYRDRPYVAADAPYEVYAAAYRFGWEAHGRHAGRSFEDVEATLRAEWEEAAPEGSLLWDEARGAVRDAWDRVDRRATSRV
jgi:phage tail tape-measure protein